MSDDYPFVEPRHAPIRDERRHNFFIVDNEIISDYAAAIGPNGLAVYLCLVRFAGYETKECHVRVKRIAALLGCSENTVRRALKTLTGEDGMLTPDGRLTPLIAIREQYNGEGAQVANGYILLPVKKADPPSLSEPTPLPNREAPPASQRGQYQYVIDQDGKEQEREALPASGTKKKRQKPEVPWPADFTLTEERRQYAKKNGMPEHLIGIEFEKFHNWALGKGVLGRDWDARWRTWVLNDQKYRLERQGQTAAAPVKVPTYLEREEAKLRARGAGPVEMRWFRQWVDYGDRTDGWSSGDQDEWIRDHPGETDVPERINSDGTPA